MKKKHAISKEVVKHSCKNKNAVLVSALLMFVFGSALVLLGSRYFLGGRTPLTRFKIYDGGFLTDF